MRPWQPILHGKLLSEARSAIEAIASDLMRPHDDWPLSQPEHPSGLRSVSLASGRAGLALFHAYYEQTLPDEPDESPAARFLNEAHELTTSKSLNASLFCGFTGVAWTTEHLLNIWHEQTDGDMNEDIDRILLEFLDDGASAAAYDLIDGLVGVGVYALERHPRPAARLMLERITERLDERALPQPIGRALPSGPPATSRDSHQLTAAYYNLGLSHGNPGVIAFLGKVCRLGIAAERAARLLADLVVWLLSQKLPSDFPSAYCDHIGPDLPPRPARTAWCYGDPGIAAALLTAARCLGRLDWEQAALGIAHRAAARPPEDTGIVDAGLCHGAAGVAQVFQRIHHATGDRRCAEAARFWFEKCLAMRTEEESAGGFRAFCFERQEEGEWAADPCWLSGASGIGLALLAASTNIEPLWDRAMLLEIPVETTG